MRKDYAAAAKLTDSQKADIKKEFREWSGGYHPGEAAEEHDRFLEEWEGVYGREPLDAFLTQWGEEESTKDTQAHKAEQTRRAEGFRKNMQKLASSFVTMDAIRRSAVLTLEDPSNPGKKLVFKLVPRSTELEAKAEAADVMWAVQLLLERGAVEGSKSGIVGDFEKLLKR